MKLADEILAGHHYEEAPECARRGSASRGERKKDVFAGAGGGSAKIQGEIDGRAGIIGRFRIS